LNKWLKNSTPGALAVSLLCLFALFVDGINLTDLLPDSATVNFEEGWPSPDEARFAASDVLIPNCVRAGQSCEQQDSPAKSLKLKRVFFDQDSPSLAADPSIHALLISTLPAEEHPFIRPVLPARPLYLRQCSLLL
jgi:hypothetical protein